MRIQLNPAKLAAYLQTAEDRSTFVIAAEEAADRMIGELTGETVKQMEEHEAVLEIRTATAAYRLPMPLVGIEEIASRLGADTSLDEIRIRIEVAAGSKQSVQALENAAGVTGVMLAVPPVEFTVRAEFQGRAVTIDRFAGYVERELRIPADTDPSRIATAVVLEPDGSLRHVPTRVVQRDGVWYAVVRSMTNSVYALIYNEAAFADTASHWSQASVHALASRLVLQGEPNGLFAPDRAMTRAELAAALLRTLGLPERMAAAPVSFADVASDSWYGGTVAQAASFGLLEGYEDGTFRPESLVTRAEAFVVLQRALAFAGVNENAPDMEQLSAFNDASSLPEWAAASAAALAAAGLLEGDDASRLNPERHVSRAEGAAMLWRLLELVQAGKE